MHFRASDNVAPIQPGDTSNVEETSYFTAGFAVHQILNLLRDSSMPQQNKTRDKVGIDLFSGGFETLLCHWYDTMISILL